MKKNCPACGFSNPADTIVCELCGEDLDSDRKAEESFSHRIPTAVRKKPDGSRSVDGTDTRFPAQTSDGAMLETSLTIPDDDESSGDQSQLPPISAVGEQALDAAAYSEFETGSATRSLLGQIKLVVEQGLIIGEQYLLSETEMLIGRADRETKSYPDIDLSGQDNEYVHRKHARVQFHDLHTRVSVEHLGGANPTLVNNVPVEDGELVELQVGDRLRVGRVVMRLLSLV